METEGCSVLSDTICVNCYRQTNGGNLCDKCVARLHDLLAWFIRHGDDLETYKVNKAYAHETTGAGGTPSHAVPPEPLRAGIYMFVTDELKPTLDEYVECLDGKPARLTTVKKAAEWLQANPRLERNGATPQYMRFLIPLQRKAQKYLDPAQDKSVFMGNCPAILGTRTRCDTPLYAAKEDTSVHCEKCGSTWPIGQMMSAGREALLNSKQAFTATELHQILASAGILTRKPTIRKWAQRGKLPVAGEKNGHKTYLLADAYLLATGDTRRTNSVWDLIADNHKQTK